MSVNPLQRFSRRRVWFCWAYNQEHRDEGRRFCCGHWVIQKRQKKLSPCNSWTENGRTYPPRETNGGHFAAATWTRTRVSFSIITHVWARISLPHRSTQWSPFLSMSLQVEMGLPGDNFSPFFNRPVTPAKMNSSPVLPVGCPTRRRRYRPPIQRLYVSSGWYGVCKLAVATLFCCDQN